MLAIDKTLTGTITPGQSRPGSNEGVFHIPKCSGLEPYHQIYFSAILIKMGGACDVMVIVVGNGHGDTCSNLGRD